MPELKVTADHLKRDADLYVRQSTLRQVAEHGESTQRQYALRDRAVATGWPVERVHVIDRDLGKSGVNGHRSFRDCGLSIFPSWRLQEESVISRWFDRRFAFQEVCRGVLEPAAE
jgi:hypothetical protein